MRIAVAGVGDGEIAGGGSPAAIPVAAFVNSVGQECADCRITQNRNLYHRTCRAYTPIPIRHTHINVIGRIACPWYSYRHRVAQCGRCHRARRDTQIAASPRIRVVGRCSSVLDYGGVNRRSDIRTDRQGGDGDIRKGIYRHHHIFGPDASAPRERGRHGVGAVGGDRA